MVVVAPMHAKTDPDGACPIILRGHVSQAHMRDYWRHTLLWASQLQVAECCPIEVDAGPLVVNLEPSTRHGTQDNT